MAILPGRLGSLRARDIMTRDVIVVCDSDTIEHVIGKLKANRITGTPVVDHAGKFVGILSVFDLLRTGDSQSRQLGAGSPALGEDQTTWDIFEKAKQPDRQIIAERVGRRMSKQIVSVSEDAPLVEVARVMCDGHRHRVPVVEESGTLSGIITTMDVLAAIVNVADEAG